MHRIYFVDDSEKFKMERNEKKEDKKPSTTKQSQSEFIYYFIHWIIYLLMENNIIERIMMDCN